MAENRSKDFPYDNAQVYGDARRLLIEMTRIIAGFSKRYKYTLGHEIATACTELVASIALAYREQNPERKLAKINVILEKLDVAVVNIRLAYDLALTSRKENSEQLCTLMSIYKQIEGWGRSQAKRVSDGLSVPVNRAESPENGKQIDSQEQ